MLKTSGSYGSVRRTLLWVTMGVKPLERAERVRVKATAFLGENADNGYENVSGTMKIVTKTLLRMLCDS
jgi:hypothetical protein